MDIAEKRIGPPFELHEQQKTHLHNAVKHLFEGQVTHAKNEAKRVAMAILKDEEKLR